MKLEELYESNYVSEGAYVKNAELADLLEMFEEAAKYNLNVSITLSNFKTGNLIVNESRLSSNEKIYLDACQRLLEYYKNGNNKEFNSRLESILEAPVRDPKTGRFVTSKPAAPATPGAWSKVGGFLGKAANWIAKKAGELSGSFKAGLTGAATAGAEGKNNQGQTNPGWQDVNVSFDLKDVPNTDTSLMPADLKKYNIDSTIIEKLKQGSLKGINVINTSTNQLAQIKFDTNTGTFTIKQIIPVSTSTSTDKPEGKKAPASSTPSTSSKPVTKRVFKAPPIPETNNSFNRVYSKILKEYYKTSK